MSDIETAWTPGPWVAAESHQQSGAHYTWPVRTNARFFADASIIYPASDADLVTLQANARLMAAAPELVAALHEMEQMYTHAWDRVDGGLLMMEGSTARFDEACRVAREVLTKATGVNRILVDDDGNAEAPHLPPQDREDKPNV